LENYFSTDVGWVQSHLPLVLKAVCNIQEC